MGLKLSQLTEATDIADSDLMHLRTALGIDKKISGANASASILTRYQDRLIANLTIYDNVVAGDPIVLRPGGRFRKAGTIGYSEVQLSDIATGSGPLWPVRVGNDPTRFMVICNDTTATARYLRPIIVTINADGTLSVGATQASANGDSVFTPFHRSLFLDDSRFLFVWIEGYPSGYCKAVIGTVTGSSVSWGTPVTLSAISNADWPAQPVLYIVDSGKEYVLCGWRRNTANNINYAELIEINGTVITGGTEVSPEATNTTLGIEFFGYWNSVYGYAWVFYYDQTAANYYAQRILPVIATRTISLSGKQAMFATPLTYGRMPYIQMRSGALQSIVYCNTGPSLGLVTFIPQVAVGSGTLKQLIGSGSFAFLGNHDYRVLDENRLSTFVIYTGSVYPVTAVVVDLRDPEAKITTVPLRQQVVGEMGHDVINPHAIFTGIREQTTFDYYVGVLDLEPFFVGIAMESISSGNSGKIAIQGIVSGFSGLIPGATYYLTRTGTIEKFSPVYGITEQATQIGKAVSTTELLLSDKKLA